MTRTATTISTTVLCAIENILLHSNRTCRTLAHQKIFTMFKCSTNVVLLLLKGIVHGCLALHPHGMDTMHFFLASIHTYKHKINMTQTTMSKRTKISFEFFSTSMRWDIFKPSSSSECSQNTATDTIRSNTSAQYRVLLRCFQFCRLSTSSNL